MVAAVITGFGASAFIERPVADEAEVGGSFDGGGARFANGKWKNQNEK